MPTSQISHVWPTALTDSSSSRKLSVSRATAIAGHALVALQTTASLALNTSRMSLRRAAFPIAAWEGLRMRRAYVSAVRKAALNAMAPPAPIVQHAHHMHPSCIWGNAWPHVQLPCSCWGQLPALITHRALNVMPHARPAGDQVQATAPNVLCTSLSSHRAPASAPAGTIQRQHRVHRSTSA